MAGNVPGDDERPNDPAGHTIADHLYGDVFDHEHGPDADHDHDDVDFGPLEENPIWISDNVQLTSVGMDIGSSGTQVIFSRVLMRRISEELTSRYIVAERETLYQSPVSLTPYRSDTRIDEAALGAIIDEAYAAARMSPDAVDTGVVILTGEALRRENSEAIAGILAEQGGEFVCASAGHHMESRLAAYGSGAARLSYETGQRILNVDIGGGTTKLAIVEKGTPTVTAAIHIGGRLQVTALDGKITRLDPAGRHHAERAGFAWALGDRAAPEDLDRVAELMARTLAEALGPAPSDAVMQLYLTDPITDFGRIDGIMVSGGVGEYVYGRETRDFGDMGLRLGHAVRDAFARLDIPLLPAAACIRATALGASEYTVQLSGNTSFVSHPGNLLPRRNLQVVRPLLPESMQGASPGLIARAIRDHLVAFDLDAARADFALALSWSEKPDYPLLRILAEGIRDGLSERIAAALPIYLMLDGDIAMTLGRILAEELGIASDLLVIDSVQLWDFDFIDLGRIRLPSHTVPVTIKSLVFNEDPRAMRPYQRLHHRSGTASGDGSSHGHGHSHHHHGTHSHGPHSHTHDHHDHGDHGHGIHRHSHEPGEEMAPPGHEKSDDVVPR
ncbi:reactivating factor for ethanolamine ammonia lyase [Hartmannibacter diazotrophicus]|uniref:Reactivating factor for ethanolamine ammonia lyase n=1 Tax=Hartmannibacter diazotrophicus TaxID=1482074 RepID=A0A2C9DDT9_9HYPH|nr:ethanolamine ammonia-lyase reactivating factor EutA [Hartmannibacter diazotrophicus]SON57785.1 reactivating factor for ethanolamine ammonia lyase [Hartmannibacter diazotrophicus]